MTYVKSNLKLISCKIVQTVTIKIHNLTIIIILILDT